MPTSPILLRNKWGDDVCKVLSAMRLHRTHYTAVVSISDVIKPGLLIILVFSIC